MYPERWDDARNSIKNILAIRMDNIGDIILLGPALRAIKTALPGSPLSLLASPAGVQVVELMPWVDEVITWEASWQDASWKMPLDAKREMQLVEMLRERKFDVAFIFTSFAQSPYPPAYACYLAEIPFRLGFSKEFGGSLLTHWWKSPEDEGHQAERNLALVEKAGIEVRERSLTLVIPDEVQSRGDEILKQAGVDPFQPFLCIAPGASSATRRYEPWRFNVVAQRLSKEVELPIVFLGSNSELPFIAPALASADGEHIVSLVGQTSLAELAAIIRRSALIIANNSASLHIADAFERPMVILYSGSENESQFKPRSSPAILLRKDTACSPCRKFDCPYAMECLDIPPDEVIKAAIDLLNLQKENLSKDLAVGLTSRGLIG